MSQNKNVLLSKLNWIGFSLAILGTLQGFGWVEWFGDQVGGVIVAGIGLAIALIRTLWTTKTLTITNKE